MRRLPSLRRRQRDGYWRGIRPRKRVLLRTFSPASPLAPRRCERTGHQSALLPTRFSDAPLTPLHRPGSSSGSRKNSAALPLIFGVFGVRRFPGSSRRLLPGRAIPRSAFLCRSRRRRREKNLSAGRSRPLLFDNRRSSKKLSSTSASSASGSLIMSRGISLEARRGVWHTHAARLSAAARGHWRARKR